MTAYELSTYDPNLRFTIHTIRLHYRMWDFSATADITIRGNCRGFSVMDSALSTHADELVDIAAKVIGDGLDHVELTMTNPAGDTLEAGNDGEDPEDWLKSICVGIEIVKVENEVRS